MKTTAKAVQTMKRCGQWATALSAIAILFIAGTASAKDNIPFQGTVSAHTISLTQNPDGSQDIRAEEVGVGTLSGQFTALSATHVAAVDPGQQYDPGNPCVADPHYGNRQRHRSQRRLVGLDI